MPKFIHSFIHSIIHLSFFLLTSIPILCSIPSFFSPLPLPITRDRILSWPCNPCTPRHGPLRPTGPSPHSRNRYVRTYVLFFPLWNEGHLHNFFFPLSLSLPLSLFSNSLPALQASAYNAAAAAASAQTPDYNMQNNNQNSANYDDDDDDDDDEWNLNSKYSVLCILYPSTHIFFCCVFVFFSVKYSRHPLFFSIFFHDPIHLRCNAIYSGSWKYIFWTRNGAVTTLQWRMYI